MILCELTFILCDMPVPVCRLIGLNMMKAVCFGFSLALKMMPSWLAGTKFIRLVVVIVTSISKSFVSFLTNLPT